MKHGKLVSAYRRAYTLESVDIDHEMVQDLGNVTYSYSEYAARKALLEDQVFQWDCAMFGFPVGMDVLESDSPDTFDVEVVWQHES